MTCCERRSRRYFKKKKLVNCSVHARFLQQGMRKPDMLPLLHCPEILSYLICGVKCSFRSTIQKKIYLCSHMYSFRWMGTGQTGISVRLHVRKLHKKSVMDETSFVHNVKVTSVMKLNVNATEYSSFSLSEPEYGLLPSTFSRERSMFWCKQNKIKKSPVAGSTYSAPT